MDSAFIPKLFAASNAFNGKLAYGTPARFSHREFLEMAYGEFPLKGLDQHTAPELDKTFSIANRFYDTEFNKAVLKNFRTGLQDQSEAFLPLVVAQPGAAALVGFAAADPFCHPAPGAE